MFIIRWIFSQIDFVFVCACMHISYFLSLSWKKRTVGGFEFELSDPTPITKNWTTTQRTMDFVLLMQSLAVMILLKNFLHFFFCLFCLLCVCFF